jgi:glucose/arabinose dehydrogenase
MAVTLVTGDDGSNVRVGGPGDDLIYGFNPAGPQGSVTSIAATRVATVPFGPVFAVSPPGDTGRLFIGNLDGTVRILDLTTGQLLPDVFINIGSSIGVIGEGGLIGFAFDPNYASNGYFYVNVTNPSDDTEIRRYQVSVTDPNHADPASQTLLLRIDQPNGLTNHKGGWVEFGPDGYLYTALGDGGGGGDPEANGQDTQALLGKILRIDPAATTGDDYGIPADNPFADGAAGAPEVWVYGARNPWRIDFDEATGDLWVADVGQNAFEEIDLLPAADGAGRGANLGWNEMEGAHPFEGGTNPDGAVLPVFEYDRSEGGCSVTGGVVYRGSAIPALDGAYLFTDYCDGRLRAIRAAGGETVDERTFDDVSGNSLVSFGTDAAGEVYVLSLDGAIYRLDPA